LCPVAKSARPTSRTPFNPPLPHLSQAVSLSRCTETPLPLLRCKARMVHDLAEFPFVYREGFAITSGAWPDRPSFSIRVGQRTQILACGECVRHCSADLVFGVLITVRQVECRISSASAIRRSGERLVVRASNLLEIVVRVCASRSHALFRSARACRRIAWGYSFVRSRKVVRQSSPSRSRLGISALGEQLLGRFSGSIGRRTRVFGS